MYLCSVRQYPKAARDAKIDVILLKFDTILRSREAKVKAQSTLDKSQVPVFQPSTFNLQPSATPDVLSSLKKMPRAEKKVDVSTLQPSTFNSVETWVKARKEGRSWSNIANDARINPRKVSFQFIARKVSEYFSTHPEEKPQ